MPWQRGPSWELVLADRQGLDQQQDYQQYIYHLIWKDRSLLLNSFKPASCSSDVSSLESLTISSLQDLAIIIYQVVVGFTTSFIDRNMNRLTIYLTRNSSPLRCSR